MLRTHTQVSVQFETRIVNECAVTILFRPNRGCLIASQVTIKYYGRFSAAEKPVDGTRATHAKGGKAGMSWNGVGTTVNPALSWGI